MYDMFQWGGNHCFLFLQKKNIRRHIVPTFLALTSDDLGNFDNFAKILKRVYHEKHKFIELTLRI